MVDMKTVESSNVAKVGYKDSVLYIEFNSGALYTYSAVPEKVYNDLMEAESIGKFLNQQIKGTYNYERIK